MNLSTSESETNTGIHHEVDHVQSLGNIKNEIPVDQDDNLQVISSNLKSKEHECSENETPTAKKRRKQSNPVRYGQSTQPFEDIEDSSQVNLSEKSESDNDEIEDEKEEKKANPKTFEETDRELDDNEIESEEDEERQEINLSETAIDYSSIQNKYQYFCCHCGCPFLTQNHLKKHIEEEHVQKVIEQQLLHHQSILNAKHLSSSDNLSVIKSLNENSTSGLDKNNRQVNKSQSHSNNEGDHSSRENSSITSSPASLEKSFEINLPQPDSNEPQAAKDFASLLSFHLPNVSMSGLLPLTSSSSGQSATSLRNESTGIGQEKQASMQLAMFPNHIAPFLYPVIPHINSGVMSNSSSGVSSGAIHNEQMNSLNSNSAAKIFNPEAFCELCNKELCNKYFLKTHKANKHRIFSMESGGSGSFSSSPSAVAVSAAAFFPSNLPTVAGSSSNSAVLQMQNLLHHVNLSSSSPEAALALAASRSSAGANIDSYCDICQKQFCNKYFLKKHRQKIHGIFDSSISQSSPQTQSSQQNSLPAEEQLHHSSSVSSINSVDSDHLSSKMPTSPSIPSIGSETISPSVTTTIANLTSEKISSKASSGGVDFSKTSSSPLNFSNDFTCNICRKEFPNSDLFKTHQTTAHDLLFSNNSNLRSVATALQADAFAGMIGHPINLPAFFGDLNNIIFTPEKLREIGVINADAFCEICCKEFCNKYFLRTHKLNKHGINVDNASSNGSIQSDQLNVSNQSNKKLQDEDFTTSPKSFIQDESMLEPGQRDPLSFNVNFQFMNSSKELFCDICNRPFGSNYFLTMHKFYCHEIPYTRDISSPSKSQASNDDQASKIDDKNVDTDSQSLPSKSCLDEALTSELEQTSDQASQELKNLQTMIKELNAVPFSERNICTFCRKEFENKLFLKRHMIKEHSISTEGSLDYSNKMRSLFESSKVLFPSGTSFTNFESFAENKSLSRNFLEGTAFLLKNSIGSSLSTLAKKQDEQALSEKGETKKSNSVQALSSGKLPLSSNLANSSAGLVEGKQRILTGRNYCNICNKELCNKYFMKTHMFKMHGINIEEHPAEAAVTSIIGGVTCDICQKELCSKYFLKVHKQNTHGIADDSTVTKESKSDSASNTDKESSFFQAQGIDPNDTNNLYFSHYTEVCPLCERRFKSIKWLKTHMSNDHSDIVPTSNTELVSQNPSDLAKICLICGQLFPDRVALQIHFVKDHKESSDELGISNMSNLNNSGMIKTKPTTFATDLSASQPQVVSQAPILGSPQSSISQATETSRDMSPKPSITQSPTDGQCSFQAHTTSSSQLNGSVSPNEMCENESNSLNVALNSILSPNSSLNSSAISSSANAALALADGNVDVTSKNCNDFSLKKCVSENLSQTLKRSTDGTVINHCSYCNYSTRWVSNLYAHEKRHREINSEGDKKFNCRICHRAYRYNHSLQRHLQNHRLAGLNVCELHASNLNHHQFESSTCAYSLSKNFKNQSQTQLDKSFSTFRKFSNFEVNSSRPAKVKRYRCSKCNRKFKTRDQCLSHIHQFHSENRKVISNTIGIKNLNTNRHLLRCSSCSFSTRYSNLLKLHINKKHSKSNLNFDSANSANFNLDLKQASNLPLNLKQNIISSSSNCEEALSLVVKERSKFESELDSNSSSRFSSHHFSNHNQTLQSISSSSTLPMAYAMPQSPPNHGSFIMQPFLITQPDNDQSIKNDTFVPSLIYLPVSQKVLQTVTVAFQLTPA